MAFASNYSLIGGLHVPPELGAVSAILLSIASSRLYSLWEKQGARVDKVEDKAVIFIEVESAGEGPVRVGWEGLGFPRDQILVAAGYFKFYADWIWNMSQNQMQDMGKRKSPSIILPSGMFPGKNNPMMQ